MPSACLPWTRPSAVAVIRPPRCAAAAAVLAAGLAGAAKAGGATSAPSRLAAAAAPVSARIRRLIREPVAMAFMRGLLDASAARARPAAAKRAGTERATAGQGARNSKES